MNRAKFQGEEEGIARIEDNIIFTPFNLREEQREGHFDEDGTYIFKKEKNEVKDSWVQDLDNCQIADPSKFKKMATDGSAEEYDQVSNVKRLLCYMHKNETVMAAIRRIGAKINELRKTNRSAKSEEITNQIKEETKKLEDLTSLADQALFNQDVEIYEKTYEELEKLAEQPTASTSGTKKQEAGAKNDNQEEKDEDDSDEEENGRGVKRKNEFEESSEDELDDASEESSTDDDNV